MNQNYSAQKDFSEVCRHLNHLQQQGKSFGDAIKIVEPLVTESQRGILRNIQTMAAEGQIKAGLTPYGAGYSETMMKLANLLERKQDELPAFFVRYAGVSQQISGAVSSLWRSLAGIVFYLVVVVLMLTIIAGIYGVKVLPQFAEMFDNFGSELPEFTHFVFGILSAHASIYILLLIALFAFIFIGVYRIKSHMFALRPLTGFIQKLPVFGLFARTYNDFLFLVYLRLVVSDGENGPEPLEKVTALFSSDQKFKDYLLEHAELNCLAVAHSLGTLDQELDYKLSDHETRFGSQLLASREALSSLALVVGGIIVGSVIIAMYLPIFQLGSMV